MSNIELVIHAGATDLGDNFVVRRALPKKEKRMVGPFIFWDHMGPVTIGGTKEMKVRSHPHIGLSTLTWLFSGEILHRDSLNNIQAIKPGEVNWMTAGRGIAHSERANSIEKNMTLEGIQLWIALPSKFEDIAPSFFHCKNNDLIHFAKNDINLTLIAGKALGHTSVVPVNSELFYLDAKAPASKSFEMPLQNNHEGAIYVISGQVVIEGQTFSAFDLIVFKKDTKISFTAIGSAHVMIFGGEIFPERRFIFWNFVSSSQEKIEQAKKDWQENKFDPVIDEQEKIPLPKG